MAGSLPFVYRHNRPSKQTQQTFQVELLSGSPWNYRIIPGDLPMFNISITILNNKFSNKTLTNTLNSGINTYTNLMVVGGRHHEHSDQCYDALQE
jgi:hypothetical protein